MLRRICQLLRDDNEQGKTCKIEIADLDAISGNLWSSQPRLSICSLRPARVADIILLMPLALSVAICEQDLRGPLRVSIGNTSPRHNHIYRHSYGERRCGTIFEALSITLLEALNLAVSMVSLHQAHIRLHAAQTGDSAGNV